MWCVFVFAYVFVCVCLCVYVYVCVCVCVCVLLCAVAVSPTPIRGAACCSTAVTCVCVCVCVCVCSIHARPQVRRGGGDSGAWQTAVAGRRHVSHDGVNHARRLILRSLAFVNRYAETLDAIVPNLENELAAKGEKVWSPLAAQPPGTGKTVLGLNLALVLRRPREKDAAREAEIATRLERAWCWNGNSAVARATIAHARKLPGDESLVLRTLKVMFPESKMLPALITSVPVLVELKTLPPPGAMLGFDDALGFLIFVAATGVNSVKAYMRYCDEADMPRQASTVVKALVRDRGAVVLLLDDITDLQSPKFAGYFADARTLAPLHSAMSVLSLSLQELHSIKGCFIALTGRSLWLTSRALGGTASPLFAKPVLLSALSPDDVLESLHLTPGEATGATLADELGVTPVLLRYVATRVVAVTGGIGRAVQVALRGMQALAQASAVELPAPASTQADVDAVLEVVRREFFSGTSGDLLRVTRDSSAAGVTDVDMPQLGRVDVRRELVMAISRALLLDVPFPADFMLPLAAGESIRLADAAAALGFSFVPSNGGHESRALKLVAGEWLSASLRESLGVNGENQSCAAARMLSTMREFGGTMRGRAFELLCVEAMLARALLQCRGATLRTLVPHFSGSTLADCAVSSLKMVVMPKVTRSNSAPLSEDARKVLLGSREHWTGAPTLHPCDLPWFLEEWLPHGVVVVPGDATSGASDWFVRLKEGVIAVANKAVGAAAGTAWCDVAAELAKLPKLPVSLSCALVLYSLHLAPELRAAIGDADVRVLTSGAYNKRLDAVDATSPERVFTVPTGVELLVVNPDPERPHGLAGLVGEGVARDLRALVASDTLEISTLVAWQAHGAASARR